MSSQNHDRVFVVTFLGVIGFLVALTVVISIISGVITGDVGTEQTRALEQTRKAERIAPVGTVITDPAALVAVVAVDVEADERSADQVVAQVCAACHTAAVGGAPKSGVKAEWEPRLASAGLDGLVASVINGKGIMPPRAGVPGLSDEQIQASVELMLKNAGLTP